jgi:hypothetical protein
MGALRSTELTENLSKSSGKTIQGYVSALRSDQKKIVSSLIEIVQESAPRSKLSIKWAQPVFEQNGPFCYIRGFKNHVNFGFWRGAEIKSGKGVLQSGGEKMAHVKITSLDEIRKTTFQEWIREAVRLNQTKGDPTKNK